MIQTATTIYGIWNLDFFRTILPPTCLDIDTLQALSLDYAIAVYPLLLVIISYILIELHDRDTSFIVCIWTPFHRCLRPCTNRINIKSSVINAFGSFLLLSYIKFLNVTSSLLIPVFAYDVNGKVVGTFLYYDASIAYFGSEHLPYAILAIFVSLIFIILPATLLIVYPLKCCKRVTRWPALQMSLDVYQGYYKDGTDGTVDCRWFSSLHLITLIILFITFSFVKNVLIFPISALVYLLIMALYVIFQPFKKQFSTYNKVNILMYLNLVVYILTVIDLNLSLFESIHTKTLSMIMIAFHGTLPFIYVLVVLFKWLYVSICER